MGTKISNLPVIVTPALTDVFPVVQGSVTYKETFTQLSSLFATSAANSNITSLSGLTTPLSLVQGGTNSTTGVVSASVAANSGAGIPVQVKVAQITAPITVTSSTYADATGLSISITPGATTSKILLRAVLHVGLPVTDLAYFRFFNASAAVGVGTAVSSRTACTASAYPVNAAGTVCVTMEWLDSPATVSPITYTVQWKNSSNANNIYLGSSVTDTDAAAFPRTVCSFTAMEIK